MSTDRQWRTVVIDKRVRLYYDAGAMKIKTPDGKIQRVPLYNLSSVMVVSHRVRLSVYLIDQLRQRNVSLIFCDANKTPSAQMVGFSQSNQTAARLQEQIAWSDEAKETIWRHIILLKLTAQYNLIQALDVPVNHQRWVELISIDNPTSRPNREGIAARIYFKTLFGTQFKRVRKTALVVKRRKTQSDTQSQPDDVNRALNYGYAILRSAITRALVLRGYNPALGVHHRGATNPLNLAYDLIEPFRPFVDAIVYQHKDDPFDWAVKRKLIAVLNAPAAYGAKKGDVFTVIDYFITDVMRSLKSGVCNIAEIIVPKKNGSQYAFR